MAVFTNQATLTYNGLTVESNVVSGEITEVLTLYKTAQSAVYGSDPIVYIISVVNSGAQPYAGLTLTDDLGAYEFNGQTVYPLSYVAGSLRLFSNGVPQAAPTVSADAGLVISNLTVPAGGNLTLVYAALPTAFAPRAAGEGFTNTVSAAQEGRALSATAQATVLANEDPALSIFKSVNPSVIPENGTITYTFAIENTGVTAADAAANVSVSDLFDPILSELSVTLDGAPLALTTGYTYDAASGAFATVPGVITVPAATVTQDETTGAYTVVPGSATLVVTGTI